MEQNINSKAMDKLTKVCLCKAIPKSTIKKAIRNGAITVEAIQKVTGAGSGGCRGYGCTSKIEEILKQELEKEWNLKIYILMIKWALWVSFLFEAKLYLNKLWILTNINKLFENDVTLKEEYL